MNSQKILILVLLTFCTRTQSQSIKDFFYVEPESKNLPVFIRGNLDSKKILLFVQGGPGENGIDFGRADYPKWEKTIETEVAIAYFDQRGLNKSIKHIDTTQITSLRVGEDIISIAKTLKERYGAEIYLFGHSAGGQDVLDCLAHFPKKTKFIRGGMAISTPITTDFSQERYTLYRPLYLKNLATEFIQKKQDTLYWTEALKWMINTDSIYDRDTSNKWNRYVDNVFEPTKRRTSIRMIFKVVFSRPYNPIKYMYRKDNELLGDLFWEQDRDFNRFQVLPNITRSILLISGRFDDISGPEEQEAAHLLISNSELITIPNSGHEVFLDQPELFNEAVLNFINKN